MSLFAGLLISLLVGIGLFLFSRSRRTARLQYVRSYKFPKGLEARLLKHRPELTSEQVALVFDGLRQYFKITLAAKRRMVAMPSQVVDDLWHEFILHTRNYQNFCSRAFGRYLHHTPAEAMSGANTQSDALRRAWWLSCKQEGIDPREPKRLPLLFAIDGLLNIGDGFRYVPDCKDASVQSGGAHCGADLGSGSGDGGWGCAGDSSCSGDGGSSCGGGGD